LLVGRAATGYSVSAYQPALLSTGFRSAAQEKCIMLIQSLSTREAWARFRLLVIGALLASPPERGHLQNALQDLANKDYRHPCTGEPVHFGASTIERWYYLAKNHPDDPMNALARRVPEHVGTHPSMPNALSSELRAQYKEHPSWSYQLQYDNLVALAAEKPELGEVPSYSTVRRFMKSSGLIKQRRRRGGRKSTVPDFETRERRSFEVEHVHGLWHTDYHEGSRRVLLPSGQWHKCHLLSFLDDRSRLVCHLQWYLAQTAETFVHGLTQAIVKRGLPRSLLSDNGKPMLAEEAVQGLLRLGIVHVTTLPYCPEQNGKQESFWGQVEGRLLAMLESEEALTLPMLNRATQAWVELEYNRGHHSELGASPLSVAMSGPNVVRTAPDMARLRHLFRGQMTRTQRRSDGTISVGGIRFELPSRYRTLMRPTVRVARWDLSSIDLVDPHTGALLCALYPLDKAKNADGVRRVVSPLDSEASEREATNESSGTTKTGVAPHLRQLMQEYAATGLPPAYIPHASENPSIHEDNQS
jgi:putative transposase